MSIERIEVGPRMSQVVIHNDTVYLAGQVADDPTADVAGQTAQVLARIDRLLAAAGSDKTKILMTTIWLPDISDFDAMNAVYDAWTPQGHTSARACVESKLARDDLRVEIRVVAAL